MKMPVDPHNIAALVPHDGLMCLIDQIIDHSSETISCRALVHHDCHPLARNGKLPSVVAIEYGAQTCAIHGALIASANPSRPGVLVKIADTELDGLPLSAEDNPLTITAQRLSSNSQSCLYNFEVSTPLRRLAKGTLMIAFTDSNTD